MDTSPNRVFQETYGQYLASIRQVNLGEVAAATGGRMEQGRLILPFFGTPVTLSGSGVFWQDGRGCPFAVSVVLLKHCLMSSSPDRNMPDGPDGWMTFRDFTDAGPLVSYFTENTSKTIEQAYSGRSILLAEACRGLGGRQGEFGDVYDVSMILPVLPKVPAVLNFNDRDSEFPASCSVLYRRSAERFLDMECLAITGTYLAGELLRSAGREASQNSSVLR